MKSDFHRQLGLIAVLLMGLGVAPALVGQTPPGDDAFACGSATSEAVECGSAQAPASLGEVLQELRRLNEPVPKPPKLPSVAEIEAMEARLGLKFHPDYSQFLLQASDVVFGFLEPATITDPESHTHLPVVAAMAWEMGADRSWLPICEDSGDYYVLKPTGEVMYWSHDGRFREESWPDLATWIREVWIGEGTSEGAEWIHLTKEQSPPGLIISAENLSGVPELVACAEAVYTTAGVDIVTESQWDLILTVIVSPEGLIERFRVVHQPSVGIDFLEPTKEALRQWRYRPVIFEGRAKPVCLTLGLRKPLGSKTSAACADSLKGDSPCRTTASLPMVTSASQRRSAQK